MVQTRSQRLAAEREERHKKGIFTDDEDDADVVNNNSDGDNDAGSSSGESNTSRRRRRQRDTKSPEGVTTASLAAHLNNDTPRGKGCRVVRPQLTYEEEQLLEIAERKAKAEARKRAQFLKESGIPVREDRDRSSMAGIGGRRPEREAARRAMERFADGGSSSEDELLQMPGKRKANNPNLNTTMVVTYRKPNSNHRGMSDDEDDILLHGDGDGRDGETMLGRGQSAHDSLANGKRMTMNQHMQRLLSSGSGGGEKSRRGFDEGADEHRGGGGGGGGNDSDRENAKYKLADVQPIEVDMSTTFAQVGGLPSHILTLRETVLIPLLYPKLLSQLKIRPPRGVLFVGPPGTGKTLMARALAAEGSRVAGAGKKVSFFLRKGADMLSKWMGESEKQLRMLFDEARKHQPSIIFFDEIDGLAPIRHGKQDQSYAALVSTLLALLDGLTDRGQVVVIGATNRPDTLDPALRRPGRFDRELRFPMPDESGRRQIIDIHMKGQAVSGGAEGKANIREALVKMTSGWSGADLQSLCTAASLNALRRSVPQIYVAQERLKVPTSMVRVKKEDYIASLRTLSSSVQRISSGSAASVYVPQHVERLLDEEIHRALGSLGAMWAPAASALERSETEARALKGADHTRQLVFALTTQLIPTLVSTPHAAVMVLLSNPSSFSSSQSSASSSPSTCVADENNRLFASLHVAKAVVNRLPSMYSRTVHMPNIGRGGAGAIAAGGGGGSGDANGGNNPADQNLFVMPSDDAPASVTEMFSMMRSCTPGLLLLLGFEEWANNATDEEIANFKYNLSTISQSDIAVLVPLGYAPVTEEEEQSVQHLLGNREQSATAAAADDDAQNTILKRLAIKAIVNDVFMLPTVGSTVAKLRGPSDAAKEALLHEMYETYTSAKDAVTKQVEALSHLFNANEQQSGAAALSSSGGNSPSNTNATAAAAASSHATTNIVMPWPQLPIDDGPVEEKKKRITAEDRRRARDEWETIEYKRHQLRYILHKWINNFMASKKYQYFLTADLDFTPEHEFFSSWQRHVRGKKIGLQDVASKLENDEYTCLSAFNDDMERLCNNVKTFFAVHETRYRPKAMELRESIVLNSFRLQKGLVAFCEETKDAVEPIFEEGESSSSSSDDDACDFDEESEEDGEEGGESEAKKAVTNKTAQKPTPNRKKKRRRTDNDGYRKKKKKPVAPKRPREEEEEGGEEGDNAAKASVKPSMMMLEDDDDANSAPPKSNASATATTPATTTFTGASGTTTATSTSPSKFVTPPPPTRMDSNTTARGASNALTVVRPPVPTRLFGPPGSMLRSSAFAPKPTPPTTSTAPTSTGGATAENNATTDDAIGGGGGGSASSMPASPLAASVNITSAAAFTASEPPTVPAAAPDTETSPSILNNSNNSSTTSLHAPPALAPLATPANPLSSSAAPPSTTAPPATATSATEPAVVAVVVAGEEVGGTPPLSQPTRRRFMALSSLQLHQLYLLVLSWAHTFKRLTMHTLLTTTTTSTMANQQQQRLLLPNALGGVVAKSPTQYDPITSPTAVDAPPPMTPADAAAAIQFSSKNPYGVLAPPPPSAAPSSVTATNSSAPPPLSPPSSSSPQSQPIHAANNSSSSSCNSDAAKLLTFEEHMKRWLDEVEAMPNTTHADKTKPKTTVKLLL